MKTLEELLTEVDKLFPKAKKNNPAFSYDYTLGKFPEGWKFSVVNNWYAWSDKNLVHQFGVYVKPEHAVLAFLLYVKENNINVKKLCHKR